MSRRTRKPVQPRFEATRTGKGHGVWDYRAKRLVVDGLASESLAHEAAAIRLIEESDRAMVRCARSFGLI